MSESEIPVTAPAEIDPHWLASVTEGANQDFVILMPSTFLGMAAEEGSGTVKRSCLEALAIASSPMLNPESWETPYIPAAQFGGQRTVVPTDLTSEQLLILAQMAPMIQHSGLRARVADIAWTYGGRRDQKLLSLAIDSYTEIPLAPSQSWNRDGRDSWRRAIELTLRRGKSEAQRAAAMAESVRLELLSTKIEDNFHAVELSELFSAFRTKDKDRLREVASHCLNLGRQAAQSQDQRLARAIFRQAARWFNRLSDSELVNECQVEIAEAYAAEAQQRLTGDAPSALVASHSYEKAAAVLASLPNKFRQARSLDIRLSEMRKHLEATRLFSLEEMVTITTESEDLTHFQNLARAAVTGRDTLEALARLAQIQPLTDAQAEFSSAAQRIDGYFSQMIPRSTFTYDGRKVAATPGRTGRASASSTESMPRDFAADPAVWAAIVRDFGIRVGLLCSGFILPAHEILTAEHRIDRSYLFDVCHESPFVPANQAALWSLGLWHGVKGDFTSGAFILTPLIEQFVRLQFKLRGLHTMLIDENSVESEKGLSALLRAPEAVDILGADLALELRALLCEQIGANLRNNMAHGLITDGEAWSESAVYAWWLGLRIAVTPVYNMQAQATEGPDTITSGDPTSDDAAGTSSADEHRPAPENLASEPQGRADSDLPDDPAAGT